MKRGLKGNNQNQKKEKIKLNLKKLNISKEYTEK